jgi:hypothetical protein
MQLGARASLGEDAGGVKQIVAINQDRHATL